MRFEFPATCPAAISATGSQRVPLCALRPGWGEGVTFAARRGREVAHLVEGGHVEGGQERGAEPGVGAAMSQRR